MNPSTARTLLDEERVRHRLLYGDAQTQIQWQSSAVGHTYRGELGKPYEFQHILRHMTDQGKAWDEDVVSGNYALL